ncbi:unnamed protein product [Moneuplotes crassus]|uniref:RING-type domain-containing protein n=1 Tax=Euplotes crassus TaxID=5936 RepID=A0AAD1Y9B1_EUPCR|nr:unnamed protein product [Moneuplotes crassus]
MEKLEQEEQADKIEIEDINICRKSMNNFMDLQNSGMGMLKRSVSVDRFERHEESKERLEYKGIDDTISVADTIGKHNNLDECIVCNSEERFVHNSLCKHCGNAICNECWEEILGKSQECPMCRSPVTKEDIVENRLYKQRIEEKKARNQYCENHPKQICGLYCFDCEKPICNKCIPRKRHKEHRVFTYNKKTISKYNKRMKFEPQLRQLSTELSSFYDAITEKDDFNFESLRKLQNRFSKKIRSKLDGKIEFYENAYLEYSENLQSMNIDRHELSKTLRRMNRLKNPYENEDIETSEQVYEECKSILTQALKNKLIKTYKQYLDHNDKNLGQSVEESLHDIFIKHYNIPSMVLSAKYDTIMKFINSKLNKEANKKIRKFMPSIYSEESEEDEEEDQEEDHNENEDTQEEEHEENEEDEQDDEFFECSADMSNVEAEKNNKV